MKLLSVEEIDEQVKNTNYDSEEASFGNIELAKLKEIYYYALEIEKLRAENETLQNILKACDLDKFEEFVDRKLKEITTENNISDRDNWDIKKKGE
ncbi:MAG: hypothetical protein EOL95_09350 [Bacteroidia bacterium]|nr:hypothetical protein [Bacteroidia bacterium]